MKVTPLCCFNVVVFFHEFFFPTAIVKVLTWLLSAEDGLQCQPPISNNVEEVKEQFHTHEVRIWMSVCSWKLKKKKKMFFVVVVFYPG